MSPILVQEALQQYGALFLNEPERRHFAEYLTGLFVADRKNVVGINGEFAVTTDQSCLNRWLGTVTLWDEQQLNERRLTLLQHDPSTRYAPLPFTCLFLLPLALWFLDIVFLLRRLLFLPSPLVQLKPPRQVAPQCYNLHIRGEYVPHDCHF